MGFPEEIGKAQRKALEERLTEVKAELAEILDNVRAGHPHHFAMDRDRYDRVLETVTDAKTKVSIALDWTLQ